MLNENIRSIRKSKGLSQEELAIRLNVVRQTISKWEQGLSVPDSDMLISISEELETPVSALLGETVAEPEADSLKAISEKLEIINLQLAQRKTTRRKILHWLFTKAGIIMILKPPLPERLFTRLNGCLSGPRQLSLSGQLLESS